MKQLKRHPPISARCTTSVNCIVWHLHSHTQGARF